jgi:hypothetical protein
VHCVCIDGNNNTELYCQDANRMLTYKLQSELLCVYMLIRCNEPTDVRTGTKVTLLVVTSALYVTVLSARRQDKYRPS